jgi:hypothetical protein
VPLDVLQLLVIAARSVSAQRSKSKRRPGARLVATTRTDTALGEERRGWLGHAGPGGGASNRVEVAAILACGPRETRRGGEHGCGRDSC